MTKIDDSYLEKLGEVIYDEKKAINYKTVAVMLGVHVNIAKQMMYQMYNHDKQEGKKIFATYLISGMVTGKVLSSINGNRGSGSENPEAESYLVLLCRDRDLEEYKGNFSRIFSIHVYSLTSFPLENYDVLERLADTPLIDSAGRKPVDFGPITCTASQKLLKSTRVSMPQSTTAPSKSIEKKADSFFGTGKGKPVNPDKGNKETNNSSEGTKPTQQPQQKPVKAAGAAKSNGNKNNIKSMFANAPPSKPKPKVDKVIENVEDNGSSKGKGSNSKSNTNKNTKSKSDSDSRKRKRIQDILSSSESEEEDKKSSDEEETLPESPIPRRRRIQIESDSEEEDDFKQSNPSKPENEAANNEIKAAPGRRKVVKMISETRVTDDGFMVTEKKQVMVSEDEDETETKNHKETVSNDAAAKKPVDTKPSKSNNSTKPVAGKTKQQSLMSFFQKK